MKTVLITGGSRGIGAETVRLFAQNGYTVILNYHTSEAAAEALQAELGAAGCDVHLYCADISNAVQVAEMFGWIKRIFKHLDVLVNNAGVANYALCQDVGEQEFDRVMNTNAKGTFLCCRQAVPMFLERQAGCIVNVASVWGLEGASCEVVYCMSKHAVVGLTKSLVDELAPSNIKVNCVCPPIVQTDMCKHLTPEQLEEFCRERGLRVYTPAEVAQDIWNLAHSDETGIILQEK